MEFLCGFKLADNVDGIVSCGISRQFPIVYTDLFMSHKRP